VRRIFGIRNGIGAGGDGSLVARVVAAAGFEPALRFPRSRF
jgi:hypothetical protein